MDREPTVLRIVHGGEPSVEELAALVAVLARPAAAAPPPLPLRRPLPAWVASGLIKGTRTKV